MAASAPSTARTVHASCDLLLASTDRYLPEATITGMRLTELGLAQRFDCSLLLGDATATVPGYRTLNRRCPGTWSSELRDGLRQLQRPYVLLWLDDLVPVRIPDVDALVRSIDRLAALNGNYLRLNPTPPGSGPTVEGNLRTVLPTELYRTSTIFSVWRREMLIELLDEGESAWQFEFTGSVRSARYGGFYATNAPAIEFVNLVIKGMVDPRAERRLQQAGVDVRAVKKPRMSAAELRQLRFREFRSDVLKLLPWQWRSKVRYLFSTNPKSR